ncbi:N-terminal cleavage protein [Opitutaceae bacterium TAV5]|nr:N-terminal cleavage protein [Opitutaceae bacterium TAV5]
MKSHPGQNRPSTRTTVRAAFTLIELLTVIAIIGILAAIIIPTVGKVRETAKNATCISNLRQVATAMLLYAEDNRQVLPTSAAGSENWIFDLTGYYIPRRTSYIGQQLASLPTAGSGQKSIFLCETNIRSVGAPPSGAASTYGMNHNLSKLSLNRSLQTSRLVLAGDMALYNNNWELRMQPDAVNRLPGKVHNNKYHFVFLDGHAAAQADYPTDANDVFWVP